MLLYPRTKSGILRIQHGRAAAVKISFRRDNSKNILLSPFKFGMWVDMAKIGVLGHIWAQFSNTGQNWP